jgi:enterochelin esterase family protein
MYMSLRRSLDLKAAFVTHGTPAEKEAAGGDGMTSDTAGRYYVATEVGVQIFDPTGRLCGVLTRPQLDKPLTSCALAGPGREYLYATNGDKIFRRKVQAIGNAYHIARKP